MNTTISGTQVLTNSAGFTLYWFVPDTRTTSMCTGSCATYWPPVKGPATAGSGVTGTLGTITRPDGTTQATYHGHPLYTYAGDTTPGQGEGNGLNVSGWVWHEVTVSGAAPPASSPPASSGGYGYWHLADLAIRHLHRPDARPIAPLPAGSRRPAPYFRLPGGCRAAFRVGW